MFGTANISEKQDLKESALVARKRELDATRALSIHDSKKRVMGIDTLALDEQVKDLKNKKEWEKNRDLYYDNLRIEHAKMAESQYKQQQNARINAEKRQQEFRDNNQRPEQRREFDLNDPNEQFKAQPMRTGDKDNRLGISSVQILHGEDLNYATRTKKQKEQLRQWCEEKADEKARINKALKEENDMFLQRQEEASYRAYQMDIEVRNIKAKTEKAIIEFNLEQARAKQEQQREEKIKESLDNLEELKNNLESDLLTENMETTLNANNPYRFKGYHFKGLRPDQLEDIENTRLMQLQESQMLKAAEKEEDQAWHLERERQARHANLQANAVNRKRVESAQELAAFRAKQIEEKRKRDTDIKELYDNKVTGFFDKFGTYNR